MEPHRSGILDTDLLFWMVLVFRDTKKIKPHVLTKKVTKKTEMQNAKTKLTWS